MADERRRFQRIKDSPVEVVTYQGSDGIECRSLEDISRGGARLIVSEAETPGIRVTLGLKLPEQAEANAVEGQIVWARKREPYEIGVQFLSLGPG